MSIEKQIDDGTDTRLVHSFSELTAEHRQREQQKGACLGVSL